MANFYLDEGVPERVVDLLRSREHDVVSVNRLGLKGVGDHRHMVLAPQMDRIFVTHNDRDFRLLIDAWRLWSSRWGVPSIQVRLPAILVVQQTGSGLTHADLADLIHDFIATPEHREHTELTLWSWRGSRGWERHVPR